MSFFLLKFSAAFVNKFLPLLLSSVTFTIDAHHIHLSRPGIPPSNLKFSGLSRRYCKVRQYWYKGSHFWKSGQSLLQKDFIQLPFQILSEKKKKKPRSQSWGKIEGFQRRPLTGRISFWSSRIGASGKMNFLHCKVPRHVWEKVFLKFDSFRNECREKRNG